MVTMMERNVMVEQAQPNKGVRSSKRSELRGQIDFLRGERRDCAGMQVID